MVPLDNLSRLVIGAVLEDAVDQLAIVSATFGPCPETHFNEMKKSLESILVKMSEQEEGVGEGVTEIKQLHTVPHLPAVLQHVLWPILLRACRGTR